ncbi:MAG: ATP-binding protein [Planctomycetota bacterium]
MLKSRDRLNTIDPKSPHYGEGMYNFFRRTVFQGLAGQLGASLTIVLMSWNLVDHWLLLTYLFVHHLLLALATYCQVSSWTIAKRGPDGIPMYTAGTGIVARIWCGSLCWMALPACQDFTFVVINGIVLTACAAGMMITQGPLKTLARQSLLSLLLPICLVCFYSGYFTLGLAVLFFLYVVAIKGINQMHLAYCELIARRVESVEIAKTLKNKNQELRELNHDLEREMLQREKSEQERAQLQEELIKASREAGKAELATGVLHNVGNVMNSLNVGVGLLEDSVRDKIRLQVQAAQEMLQEHAEDLPRFFAEDPRGKHLLPFLVQLVQNAENIGQQLEDLRDKVEHVNAVVAAQQNFADSANVTSNVGLAELLDTALQMLDSQIKKHQVRIVRDYQDCPDLWLDKQRLVQVIVNLVKNAILATDEAGIEDPEIQLRIRNVASEDEAIIEVTDNGVGIPEDNLDKVFQHGFSTRKDRGGHGFGLHHSACALTEIGANLSASSLGAGNGATFTIRLPIEEVATESVEKIANPIPLPTTNGLAVQTQPSTV